MRQRFITVPLFGLAEAGAATVRWLAEPDLVLLGKLAGLSLVLAPLCVYVSDGNFWLLWYLSFGVATASLLRQNPTASVSETWSPVLLVAGAASFGIVSFLSFQDPTAFLEVISWTWGTLLAVVAFRYAAGFAAGCSTFVWAALAWAVLQFVFELVRAFSFGLTTLVLSLFLPELPWFVEPTMDLLTQWGFDLAALGVVWLGAAMAQEDAIEGGSPDAGHYLQLVRARMTGKI